MRELIPAGPVVLRPWRTSDFDAVARIREHSRAEFADWLPDLLQDLADPAAFVAHATTSGQQGLGLFYAITEQGEPIGQCSLHDRGDGQAEIGYWIRSDRTGRGFAPAAVKALSVEALAEGVRELVIRCDAGNARSAAVARKAGFTHEHTVELDPEVRERGTPAQTGREMTWVLSRAPEAHLHDGAAGQ